MVIAALGYWNLEWEDSVNFYHILLSVENCVSNAIYAYPQIHAKHEYPWKKYVT